MLICTYFCTIIALLPATIIRPSKSRYAEFVLKAQWLNAEYERAESEFTLDTLPRNRESGSADLQPFRTQTALIWRTFIVSF